LLKVLRKEVASAEVRDAIKKYALTGAKSTKPSRRFYASRKKGFNLLAEDGRIIDIQVYVESKEKYAAFSDPLPFGLKKDMDQKQVHQLLGEPVMSDEIQSKHEMKPIGARLMVENVGGSSKMEYLSIAPLRPAK